MVTILCDIYGNKKPKEIIKSVKDTLGISEEEIARVLRELEKSK